METLIKELQDKLFEEFKSHKDRSKIYHTAIKLAGENNLSVFSLYNETLMNRCDEWDTNPPESVFLRCWPY